MYKATCEAFEKLLDKKIPKIKELNVEYAEVLRHKQSLYSRYRQSKKEMQDFVTAKQNVDSFFTDIGAGAIYRNSKAERNEKNTER